MKPVVPEARPDARAVVYAKDQPEYKPLPANVQIPYTETKWALTWRERWYAFWRGVMYLTVMNFGGPLQPIHGSFAREKHIGASIEPLWGEGAKPITSGMAREPISEEFAKTTDGLLWALAFVEHVKQNPEIPLDSSCMLGWFANAIETGRSAGRVGVGVEVCGLEFQVEPKGQASPTRGRRYDDCTQCGRSEASHANIIPGVPGHNYERGAAQAKNLDGSDLKRGSDGLIHGDEPQA
jgi:hypothetical protein